MSRFDYLLDKIREAPEAREPFRHIYIRDLFCDADFREIIGSREIGIPPARSDEHLFEQLYAAGYKIIEFPGCITNQAEYVDWHRARDRREGTHSACEGFGMTLRLVAPSSDILAELSAFLASDAFNVVLAERCGVDLTACSVDGGIQKYLDGYEISPHPDIRRKAATFMVNINPAEGSEARTHHTHYMRMKPERAYVREFWEKTPFADRCWVPWAWCDSIITQPENNSMVIFSPTNDTMHAVKADYDHLNGQRTQLYGNLWYRTMAPMRDVDWEQLAAGPDAIHVDPPEVRQSRARKLAKAIIPPSMYRAAKSLVAASGEEPADSNYYKRRF